MHILIEILFQLLCNLLFACNTISAISGILAPILLLTCDAPLDICLLLEFVCKLPFFVWLFPHVNITQNQSKHSILYLIVKLCWCIQGKISWFIIDKTGINIRSDWWDFTAALKNDCLVWVCFTAKVITDRDSGRSRGFGFVNFSNDESASSALSAMDGKVRVLFCLYWTFLL